LLLPGHAIAEKITRKPPHPSRTATQQAPARGTGALFFDSETLTPSAIGEAAAVVSEARNSGWTRLRRTRAVLTVRYYRFDDPPRVQLVPNTIGNSALALVEGMSSGYWMFARSMPRV